MLLLWWCPFKIQKEKWPGLQLTRTDYLSLVMTPFRIRWTIPLSWPGAGAETLIFRLQLRLQPKVPAPQHWLRWHPMCVDFFWFSVVVTGLGQWGGGGNGGSFSSCYVGPASLWPKGIQLEQNKNSSYTGSYCFLFKAWHYCQKSFFLLLNHSTVECLFWLQAAEWLKLLHRCLSCQYW